MNNKAKLFLVFILFNGMNCAAQNYIDLVKLEYLFSPNNAYKDTSLSTKLHDINGELTVPIQLGKSSTLLTGMYYEFSSASFSPGRKAESVYGTLLKLGLNLKHSNHWSGTYMLLPRLSSDLKKIAKNDFQFGGFALCQYTQSPRLNYKFGLYANADLFGPFFVPLLGAYYLSKNEKLEIKGVLPFNVDVNYSFAKRFRVGVNFKGQVRTYNLNTPVGLETSRYLAKSTNEASGYLQVRLTKVLHVQVAFGRSLARSFRIYNESVNWALPLYYNGDQRRQLNKEFGDGWLFKIGILYRLPL